MEILYNQKKKKKRKKKNKYVKHIYGVIGLKL